MIPRCRMWIYLYSVFGIAYSYCFINNKWLQRLWNNYNWPANVKQAMLDLPNTQTLLSQEKLRFLRKYKYFINRRKFQWLNDDYCYDTIHKYRASIRSISEKLRTELKYLLMKKFQLLTFENSEFFITEVNWNQLPVVPIARHDKNLIVRTLSIGFNNSILLATVKFYCFYKIIARNGSQWILFLIPIVSMWHHKLATTDYHSFVLCRSILCYRVQWNCKLSLPDSYSALTLWFISIEQIRVSSKIIVFFFAKHMNINSL